MITIPSAGVLLVTIASALVLMTCQWIISGIWVRNRRPQEPGKGPGRAGSEFDQAA
jgi:hypothetical protein